MRIHDSYLDESVVPAPENWPEIKVSEMQTAFGIDDKISSDRLLELMTVSVDEIVSNFDAAVIQLPLADAQVIQFRDAVFHLTFSKLIPDLPVNNQHKSDPEDIERIKQRMEFHEGLSVGCQKKIPGYLYKSDTHPVTSELICAD